METFRIKYVQHWWLDGGIDNKIIDVLAESSEHAKRIVEQDLCLGGVYGHLKDGNDLPL